ncbi:MAG: ankyrin repeat domain-containing protein [Chloroflexia bacterium]|nr:ankyrin repeat domain-containing protein [Chloroflexia bacterium]
MKLFDINRQMGKEKKTPLITAIEKNDTKKFLRLVNDPKIDINLGDAVLRTPLMYAFFMGRVEFIQPLIQKGASVHNADVTGRDLFFYYAELNKPDVLNYLLSLGAQANCYSEVLKKHAFEVMSDSTLQAIVPAIPFDKMISILKHQYAGNKVRSFYVKYLKQLQKWPQLITYLHAMDNWDHVRGIKIEIFEALPPNFIDDQLKNCILEDYILLKKIPQIVDLITNGANINQFLSKKFIVTGDTYPRLLIHTTVWDELLPFLEQTGNYACMKQLLQFAININDINKLDNHWDSDVVAKKKAVNQVYAMLPKKEIDQEIIQTAFIFMDNPAMKSLISSGFDIDFRCSNGQHVLHLIDKEIRWYIFKKVSVNKLLLIKEMSMYWDEYLEYLSQKGDGQSIDKLYWAIEDDRTKIAISNLLLKQNTLPTNIKQNVTKLYKENPDLFMDMPAEFVQHNESELQNIIKYYVKAYKNSEDFDDFLARFTR